MNQSNNVRLMWGKHQATLLYVFDALLDNEKFTDCTISAEGQHLRAHKIILSACSPYFEDLFTDSYEKHPIIILHDVKYNTVKALIDFMYHGEVAVPQEELTGVLKLSQSLQVRGLSGSGCVDNVSMQKGSGTASPAPAETLPSQPATLPCLTSGQNEPGEKGQLGTGCSETVSSQEGRSSMITGNIPKSNQNYTKSINQSGSDQGTGQNAFEEVITPDVARLHHFPSHRHVQPTQYNSAGGLVYSPILKTLLLGAGATVSISSHSPTFHQSVCSELKSPGREVACSETGGNLLPEDVLSYSKSANLSAYTQEVSLKTKSETFKSSMEIVEDLTANDGDYPGNVNYRHDSKIIEDEREGTLVPENVLSDRRSANLNAHTQAVSLKTKSETVESSMEIVEDLTVDDDDDYTGDENYHHDYSTTEDDTRKVKIIDEGRTNEEVIRIQRSNNHHSPFGSYYLNNTTLKASQTVSHNRFSCQACGNSYRCRSGLSRHKAQCGKEPQLQCPHCSYRCARSDNLKQHIIRHYKFQ